MVEEILSADSLDLVQMALAADVADLVEDIDRLTPFHRLSGGSTHN